ncbi:hypothetical protein ACOCEA_09780 [Maribacter sp. CXY002]|uniref:hypothetical protein n=1 Tax=Maribacter luteocoastalis TaxID=3407671 RepID=UPI003B6728AF
MLYKILLVFFMFLLLASCYEPQRNCNSFKTGEFTFEYKIGDSVKSGKFIRNESFSIDYYDGKIDSARVRWINDCEFILQDLNNKVGVQYKIISTTDSSYTFQYSNAIKDPNRKLIVKTGTAFKSK